MGFRTVVVLSNDQAHEWTQDPELGRKIMQAGLEIPNGPHFQYGKVVEQVHADTQSIIVTDAYSGFVKARTNWYREQGTEARDLELLKRMAAQMGYTLRKMPKAKKV